MERDFFEHDLRILSIQRNFLVTLSLLLLIGNLITGSFLFFKKERVVVVPSIVEKEFWIDSQACSASYLEQFGIFLGQLLLSKSSYSAELHRAILCRHTEPKYLHVLKQKLTEEEEILKRQNASYVFFLNQVFVNPQQLMVTLSGDRQFFYANQSPSSEKCAYSLYFTYNGSRLLLNGIVQEKESNIFKEKI